MSETSMIATRWADQLGLAISPLFGPESQSPDSHFALLDGRNASFAWSGMETLSLPTDRSISWRWSADLAHHVTVTASEVEVRSGLTELRRFGRSSVERNLPDFIRFLAAQRKEALPDVITFLVDEFLQLWATIPGENAGHQALGAFLVGLMAAGESEVSVFQSSSWRIDQAERFGFDPQMQAYMSDLPPQTIERAMGLPSRTPHRIALNPSLVIRHAAGRLFQEAHAYLESAQYGLFNASDVRMVPSFSPTGAYFTPLPIARSLAESAMGHFHDLPNELAIADYACGSAVFLTEALRVLERRDFHGKVTLIGRDISAEAIMMSRVAIEAAKLDLVAMEVSADLRVTDSTSDTPWPKADIILMNPPFRSWENMSVVERDWVKRTLGTKKVGRPDMSVAFVERAVASLNSGGVLGSLVPAGVLASESLGSWRQLLLERTHPRLIAVLGEHGLFRHALVNIGVMVLANGVAQGSSLGLAWAAPEAGAASSALRGIRHLLSHGSNLRGSTQYKRQDQWQVTSTSLEVFREKPSWLPSPNSLGQLLPEIRATIKTTVGDLFDVRQGIRTGANEVFLQSAAVVSTFPERERQWFKPAVGTESFVNGEIIVQQYLFTPDADWRSEADVKSASPRYFELFLYPNKVLLGKRKGIDESKWWQLTRGRSWMAKKTPRLLSKRFGLLPAFARDFDAEFAVVQANAWVPTRRLLSGVDGALIPDLLNAYWWLLNSRVAVSLFREYAPNVSGGQLDLEHKYVKHVPLPNLSNRLATDPSLQALLLQIKTISDDRIPKLSLRDAFASAAFGTSVHDWPGLDS